MTLRENLSSCSLQLAVAQRYSHRSIGGNIAILKSILWLRQNLQPVIAISLANRALESSDVSLWPWLWLWDPSPWSSPWPWPRPIVWVNPPPWNFVTFFPKRLGIFSPNFTHLLHVPIYAGLQIFVQLAAILTKLCHPVHIVFSKCRPSAETHAGIVSFFWHFSQTVGNFWSKFYTPIVRRSSLADSISVSRLVYLVYRCLCE